MAFSMRHISDGLLLHLTVFDYRCIGNPSSVYYAFGLPSMYRAQLGVSDGLRTRTEHGRIQKKKGSYLPSFFRVHMSFKRYFLYITHLKASYVYTVLNLHSQL